MSPRHDYKPPRNEWIGGIFPLMIVVCIVALIVALGAVAGWWSW